MNTIKLLPVSKLNPKDGISIKDYQEAFEESWRIAPTLNYIPDSLETLREIAYMDIKIMLDLNRGFYEAVVELCSDIISEMIEDAKRDSRKKSVKNAKCLDDFLKSGYYSKDYEESRSEFVGTLVEVYLWR